MFEKGVPDLLVVRAPADIEKVDGHCLVVNADFLDPIVNSNCRDVLIHEFALTIPLDNTGFACLGVSY